MEKEETRIGPISPLTTEPATTAGFTESSWDWTTPLPAHRSKVRGGGVTEVFVPGRDFDDMEEHQVHLHKFTKDLNIHITAHEEKLTVNLSGGVCRLERADRTRLRHPQHDAKLELCKCKNCQTSAFRCGLTRLSGTQFVSNRLGWSASWTPVMGIHKAPRLSHFKQFKCLYCHSAVMSDLKANSDTFWFGMQMIFCL